MFLEDGRLVLGDFGIAKQIVDGNKVELDGFTPDHFAPLDNDSFEWSPSDDVYQLGLLALSMLSGWEVINEEVCREALKALDADDSLKGWIRMPLWARTTGSTTPRRHWRPSSDPSRDPHGSLDPLRTSTLPSPGSCQ